MLLLSLRSRSPSLLAPSHLSALKVPKPVQKVGDHNIPCNHGVGEDGVLVVLAGDLEGVHGLLLEVLHAHLLGILDVSLLVKLGGGEEGGGGGGGESLRGKVGGDEGGSEGKKSLRGGWGGEEKRSCGRLRNGRGEGEGLGR